MRDGLVIADESRRDVAASEGTPGLNRRRPVGGRAFAGPAESA